MAPFLIPGTGRRSPWANPSRHSTTWAILPARPCWFART